LQDALSQATTQANNKVNDYNTGRKALQDEYTTAYQREQDAKAAADSAAKFAYQQQQDAITNRLNQQKASSGGGGGGGSSAATPTSTQRKGGGFNFTDASGNPISARLYAQLTGTSFNTVLKKMAASGDTGAAAVLKSGAKAASYKALTWD
jgi:hypothetical protein